MQRSGRNGQQRGGGGWGTQQGRGGGNQRNNNGAGSQRNNNGTGRPGGGYDNGEQRNNNGGGGRPGGGYGNGNERNNGGGSQQAWPSLGSRQAPAQTTGQAAGSWRAAPNNNGGRPTNGNTRPSDNNGRPPPQSVQSAPAWPRLPQGNAPPPASAWQAGAARPLGVPPAPSPTAAVAEATAGAVGGRPAERVAVREESRGTMRGKRAITEEVLIRTKPSGVTSKCGSSGRQVTVETNYFLISKKPDWTIHQYRVDFSPDVEMPRVRQAYLFQHKDRFGGRLGYIFDGTVMFTTTYLPEARQAPIEMLTKNREGETIQIKMKHVGIVEASDIQQLNVLNLIMRRAMEGLKLQLLNRNYYDPDAMIPIPKFNLQVWPGYVTSIRQHERDILLCCEIAHKVLRTETLYDILRQCFNEGNYQDAFKRRVIGSIVLTAYNNKTYRIDDVDFQQNAEATFLKKDRPVSYVDYYQQAYGITIRDKKQPLLVSRPTEKNIRGGETRLIYLIPELARATGLTDEMRNDFHLMKAVSEYTRLAPNTRIERLIKYNRRVNGTQESVDYLRAWHMNLDANLVQAPARVLQPAKVLFGNNASYTCQSNADWTRELQKMKMFRSINMNRWCVIAPERSMNQVQAFVKMCMDAARGMGMALSQPMYYGMQDDRTLSYARAIDEMSNRDAQILMVVLNRQNEEKYSCIKKKCCVDKPIPSQVCTLSKIAPRPEKARGLMSIATKVVIQMNAKLGGIPWNIDLQMKDSVMFVGFDVCHSAKDKNKSYGALVATVGTRHSGKYFSTVMQHLKGQELSNEIVTGVTMALRAHQEELGCLPERIIFYRDGVGDGQLHQVYNIEIKELTKKLEELYAPLKLRCKMAFIVVSKRINTRFFTNGRNPEPGTVVDDVITMPERYDFYLVSQSVNQGTVSPTSYNIIYDTSGLSADVLQKLTYAQTHLYYNWSGSCRVPAVCQYAHKLAALVAEYIHYNPSNSLSKQLYFL